MRRRNSVAGFLILSLLMANATKVSTFARENSADKHASEQAAASQPASDPAPAQKKSKEAAAAEEVKRKIVAMGIASRVTVVLKNGNEYYGAISGIEDDRFQLSEIDLKREVAIGYTDVKKVRSGFGNPNPLNGKRWHPAWHIAGLAIAAGLLVVTIAAAAASSR
jgi:hypothetical protein